MSKTYAEHLEAAVAGRNVQSPVMGLNRQSLFTVLAMSRMNPSADHNSSLYKPLPAAEAAYVRYQGAGRLIAA